MTLKNEIRMRERERERLTQTQILFFQSTGKDLTIHLLLLLRFGLIKLTLIMTFTYFPINIHFPYRLQR